MSLVCDERAPEHGADVETLARRFGAGGHEAVGRVFDRYGSDVLAVTRRVLRDGTLAEDAAQDTFLKAWVAAPSFDTSRSVVPWLRTIARRTAIDVQRREARRRGVRTVRDDDVATAPPSVEGAWEAAEVRAAVRRLPQDERDVVGLQHFGGLSHREIADRLDVPLGTVKSRSHRAHRRLAGDLVHLRA